MNGGSIIQSLVSHAHGVPYRVTKIKEVCVTSGYQR